MSLPRAASRWSPTPVTSALQPPQVWDPRTASVTAEWTPHDGGKAFKLLFLGSSPNMLTVGFTKQSKREFKLWDGRVLGGASKCVFAAAVGVWWAGEGA